MSSFKLTKLEKHWIYYDIGNSAFTMLLATIIPIYFNGLAESLPTFQVWTTSPTGAMPPLLPL